MAFVSLYTFGVHLKVAQTQIPVSLSLQKLADHYYTIKDFDVAYKNIMNGQGAYMASSNNLIYMMSLYSKNGIPTMRLLKECFQADNTAVGVQSHSPLKRNLDQAVNWVREAGLPYQWRRETLMILRQERRANASNDAMDAPEPEPEPESEGENRVSFSLEHLQGVFIMYGVGCGLSLIVFVSELPIYY
ncbi:hypothetical protein O3P69_004679 [Scylla paramamosain]|uniref:Uncharacterized protein n=1 Tax=Scylla paramamosain TaxID=85552 RepID=A0AAW0UAM8_SCYPA